MQEPSTTPQDLAKVFEDYKAGLIPGEEFTQRLAAAAGDTGRPASSRRKRFLVKTLIALGCSKAFFTQPRTRGRAAGFWQAMSHLRGPIRKEIFDVWGSSRA